jgi:hypothetical protein
MNCSRALPVLPLMAWFCLVTSAAPTVASSCIDLHFGEDVLVRGRMIKRTYAGPPNYQSIRRGDVPERVRILKLDKPVCLYPLATDLENETTLGVSEAQLVFLRAEHLQNLPTQPLQYVFVTGQFFSAQSGHHHTPALLEVFSICPEKSMRPTRSCADAPLSTGIRPWDSSQVPAGTR